MKKLQDRAMASRPYAESIQTMMGQIAAHVPDDVSPLLAEPTSVERECLVVVGADKGLCGAFNSNLFRSALQHMEESKAQGIEVEVYTFGARTAKFFNKLGVKFVGAAEERMEQIGYRRVAEAMSGLTDDFVEGRFQRVSVIFTYMESAMKFEPRVVGLLPVPKVEATDDDTSGSAMDFIMEPSASVIMQRLIPKSLEMKLFNGVLESLASEFASRRMAMKNATDSASDMIDDLTMEYNKARQSGITGELLEIVAGAEALNG
jgi:F-type H+-transporting ATPase subunit gamma